MLDDDSVKLGIKGETPIKTCPLFAQVKPECREWFLIGIRYFEWTVTKPTEK